MQCLGGGAANRGALMGAGGEGFGATEERSAGGLGGADTAFATSPSTSGVLRTPGMQGMGLKSEGTVLVAPEPKRGPSTSR